MKNNKKGFNMFNKQKKTKRKVSTLLYVDATNKTIDRALSEFKRKVKNSNMLKELREREFYQKPSAVKREKRKQRAIKIKSLKLDD
jgi:small subunit ribosomal protein S21|tara:strand:- start:366 stop:623 length:258 start_codon:yes stop_codon:yes gene_type:complete